MHRLDLYLLCCRRWLTLSYKEELCWKGGGLTNGIYLLLDEQKNDELDLKRHHDPVTEVITRLCISVNTDWLSPGGPGDSSTMIT